MRRKGLGSLHFPRNASSFVAAVPALLAQWNQPGGFKKIPLPGRAPARLTRLARGPRPPSPPSPGMSPGLTWLFPSSAAATGAGIIITSRTPSCIRSKSWPPFWSLQSLRISSVTWECECWFQGRRRTWGRVRGAQVPRGTGVYGARTWDAGSRGAGGRGPRSRGAGERGAGSRGAGIRGVCFRGAGVRGVGSGGAGVGGAGAPYANPPLHFPRRCDTC